MGCFQNDLKKSVQAFDKFSRHALKEFFGSNAQIHSYENSDDPAEKFLDMNFGIDGYIIDSDGWAHNYAARTQYRTCYRSFTLRACRPSGTKTEIQKYAQKVDEPKPEYHIHAYIDEDGRGAVVSITETVELYRYVCNRNPELKFNQYDGVGFFVIPWSELATVKIYHVDDKANVRDVTATFRAAA